VQLIIRNNYGFYDIVKQSSSSTTRAIYIYKSPSKHSEVYDQPGLTESSTY